MYFFWKLAVVSVCSTYTLPLSHAQRIPTGTERQEVLDAHNQARRETAEMYNVANMPELVWSDAAAQHGLNWLNQQGCFSGGLVHSDSYAAGFGENIARGQGSWTAAIYDAWYASELSCYDDVAPNWTQCVCTCGHMTAVTWAATTVVGCATCDSNRAWICNYGEDPPNFTNRLAFDTNSGTPCSACPSNMANCNDGLCTNGTGNGNPSPTDTQSTDAPSTDPPVSTGGTQCGTAISGFAHQGSTISQSVASSADQCCASCQDNPNCRSYHLTEEIVAGFSLCSLYDEPYDGTGASSSGAVYNLVEDGEETPDSPSPTDAAEGPCLDNPCDNNAECIEDGADFECDCLSGWEGRLCDEDINDCSPLNPCFNDGVCTDRGTNDFSCDCPEGYQGVQCESATEAPQGICATLVGIECGSRGVCAVDDDNDNGWVCECQRGYENPLDENTCSIEFRGRFRFTFDQELLQSDVEVFQNTFRQTLAAYLDLEPERIFDVQVQYLHQPMQVDAFIAGAVDVMSPTVLQLYDALRQDDSTTATVGLTQMSGFALISTVECIGDDCPAVSDETGPDVNAGSKAESTGGSGMPVGMMVGVVIAVVLIIAFAIVGALWGWKRYKNNKLDLYDDQDSLAPVEIVNRTTNPTMYHSGRGAPAFPSSTTYGRDSTAESYAVDGRVSGGAF